MNTDAASTLLGLGAKWDPKDIEAAFLAKRVLIEDRLSTAPTEGLRSKYRAALDEVNAARSLLLAEPPSHSPHLSHTQLADLPGAQPVFTQFGGDVQSGAASAHLQPGQVLANRYEIRQRIGMGGMGAVYRALDRNRNEEIAIKVLLPHLLRHPVARERFLTEAKISITLAHPNIVNVFDVQHDGEHNFLTMELLKGQTLRAVMQARKSVRKPFSVAEVIDIANAIGGALDYAHKKTVHRDVKPENVWVVDEDDAQDSSATPGDFQYKLMDFGIARLMSTSQMTQTSTAMGSAYYMAPEQMQSAKDVDARADQYSLAVMVYELLTGEVPAGRIKALRERDKKVPRGLSLAVDKALSPRPHERYPTMATFVKALSTPMGGLTWKHWAAIGLGILVLVGAVVGFWPQISNLIPSPAQNAELRAQAIQAQAITETLLKRVEASEREIDSAVREAKSQVERTEAGVRSARTNAEKQDMLQRLDEARQQFALMDEVRTQAGALVFKTDAIGVVKGQLNLGASALKDGKMRTAADQLQGAQKAAEALLDVPGAIKDALIAKTSAETAVADLKLFGEKEKREVDASAPQAQVDAGIALLKEGKYVLAKAEFVLAQTEAQKTLNAAIEDLIARYAALADRASAADDLDTAGKAISRAKALRAMKK